MKKIVYIQNTIVNSLKFRQLKLYQKAIDEAKKMLDRIEKARETDEFTGHGRLNKYYKTEFIERLDILIYRYFLCLRTVRDYYSILF